MRAWLVVPAGCRREHISTVAGSAAAMLNQSPPTEAGVLRAARCLYSPPTSDVARSQPAIIPALKKRESMRQHALASKFNAHRLHLNFIGAGNDFTRPYVRNMAPLGHYFVILVIE